jgi:hypothetical protein
MISAFPKTFISDLSRMKILAAPKNRGLRKAAVSEQPLPKGSYLSLTKQSKPEDEDLNSPSENLDQQARSLI